MSEPDASQRRYRTRGGITIHRSDHEAAVGPAAAALVECLDRYPGVFMSSCFEFPGRYTRWDLGFAAPPLAITCRGRGFEVTALEPRGRVLLAPIRSAIEPLPAVAALEADGDRLHGHIHPPVEIVPEEQRSRQPSIFSLLRAVIDLFGNDEDQHFGLYGAFGYDLAHQFRAGGAQARAPGGPARPGALRAGRNPRRGPHVGPGGAASLRFRHAHRRHARHAPRAAGGRLRARAPRQRTAGQRPRTGPVPGGGGSRQGCVPPGRPLRGGAEPAVQRSPAPTLRPRCSTACAPSIPRPTAR